MRGRLNVVEKLPREQDEVEVHESAPRHSRLSPISSDDREHFQCGPVVVIYCCQIGRQTRAEIEREREREEGVLAFW